MNEPDDAAASPDGREPDERPDEPELDDGWSDDDWDDDEWVPVEGPGDAPTPEPSGEPYVYEASVAPGDPEIVEVLRRGWIEVLGLMPWSSNGTFLVEVRFGDAFAPAIYKPERGERPLWDFPGGLWRREVAAFELSESMGFGLVPPTVERGDDAPMGRGSLQAFVPADHSEHYFTHKERDELLPQLRTLCGFDLVANSADRKGGHCLIDGDDRIWAIDNGLCFHDEFKVRTVIWDFAGEPLPGDVAEALRKLLDDGVSDSLRALLTPDEVEALLNRTRRLLSLGQFPHDGTGRRYPWPLV